MGTPSVGGLVVSSLKACAQYIVVACVLATAVRSFANASLRAPTPPHTVEQHVEWMYALDVHCSAYWPVFLVLHVVHLLLLPLCLPDTFTALLLGNSLYAAAAALYCYYTFRGYLVLPFLRRTTALLYPVVLLSVLFVLSLLFRVHLARSVLQQQTSQ